MENNILGKHTTSFGLSLAVTSLLSAILVVVKELSQNGVLAVMKTLTPHHWITHTLFALIVFFVLGWALARMNNHQGLKIGPNSLVGIIVGGVVISGIIVAGFYLIEG